MRDSNGYSFRPAWGPGGAGLLDTGVVVAPQTEQRSFPGYLALLLALYLASVPGLSYSYRLELNWVPQLLAVVVSLNWLLLGLLTGRRLVWPMPVVLYVIWALWAMTGLGVTIAPEYCFEQWQTLMKVVLITCVASQCVRTRADLLICFLVLSFMTGIIFAEGVEDIVRAATVSASQAEGGQRAEETLISNANMLGLFAILVLIGNTAVFLASRSLFFRLLSMLPMPLALYIVAASGSRKAMGGIVLMGAGFYFFHLRKAAAGRIGRKILAAVVGAVVIAASIYFVKHLPFLSRLTETFEDPTAYRGEARYQYFLRGMEATAQAPLFGLGLGGFAAAGLGAGEQGFHYSHSTITETLCCTGVPGFLLYFVGQFALFNLLRKLRKARLPKRDATVVDLMMVLFFVALFYSALGVFFANKLLWPLLGGICGYLAHLKQRYLDAPAYAPVA